MGQPPSGQGKGRGGSGGDGKRTTTSGAVPAARTSTGTGIPRTSTGTGIPRTTTGEQAIRRSPALTGLPNVRAGVAAFELGSTTDSKSFKKGLEQSAFHKENTNAGALLGSQRTPPPLPEEEHTGVGRTFDGTTPPAELTSRDVWKAINAPLQSRVGRRSAELYTQILNQFAVGTNPRYAEDGPDKPRGHIFVWDVTRAMSAEIPHFVGTRELSLGRTGDWLRHEGTMRGWRKINMEGALASANEGRPVVALPKDSLVEHMAMVRPGEPGPDGRPRLVAAALLRGNELGCKEAFGVTALEYFVHE